MNLFYKSVLSSIFVLTPLSAAMAVDVLPTINVTANRVAVEDKNTMAGVTIIDREEIERKQYNSLEDILKTLPSVSFKNEGGRGKTSSILMRGTSSKSMLVLINGQKVGSATLGTSAFEHFPVEQIERVEVIRGPRSSLYGSEAVGGVIQIFTRKGVENGVKPYASFTYGSHETYQGNVGVNIVQDGSWANLTAAGTKTQGINVKEPGQWGADPDRDGYESKSVSLNAGHKFSDQFEVEANVLNVDAKNEYDAGPNARANIKQNVYGIGAKYKPFDIWTTELKLGRTEDKLESIEDEAKSKINTHRDNLSWLNTITLNPDHILMVGMDYQNDDVKSDTAYSVTERDNQGYFAQYLGTVGAVELQGAVRFDDNEQFGHHTTGNATVGYHFNDHYNAYLSWGKAFRMPTFNELYWPTDLVYGGGGNPHLKPEQSENFEIGFKGSQFVDWQLNGFINKIDNMIVGWPAENVDQARIKGVELVLGQDLKNWIWNMNYTYQDPENRSGASKGKQINYVAKQIFNLSADYKMQQWSLGGAVHAEDKRYIDSGNMNKAYLPSFATADVRVGYEVTPEFSIQAKLANMFDKEYQTSQGYYQDGRTAWVTLRYAMK